MLNRVNAIVLLLIPFLAIVPAQADIWHVNVANGSGVEDGTSWASAFTTLQPALDAAATDGGGEVWVAQGIYGEPRGGAHGAVMLREGVEVYGGFAGAETARDQRDYKSFPVLIDGSAALGGLPAIHVVIGADNARLDGVAVAGGSAQGSGTDGGGGGMLNTSASPTVANCLFFLNDGFLGGAVLNAFSNARFEGCTFSENTTGSLSGSGGAAANLGGAPQFMDCRFLTNTAVLGGGVYNTSNTAATYLDCYFEANDASLNGGAMYNDQSTPAFLNCAFSKNTATSFGGAAENSVGVMASYVDCAFNENTGSYAGAFYNSNKANVSFTRCTFEDNAAKVSGGAIWATGSSTLTLNECTFDRNIAQSGLAGAVFLDVSTAVAANCAFNGNEANFGGAMHLLASSLNLDACAFMGNKAVSKSGGAIHADSAAGIVIANSTFGGNSALNSGGALLLDAFPVQVTNCVFDKNTAVFGGAVSLGSAPDSQTFSRCLFTGNSATTGGGLAVFGGRLKLVNSIFANNDANDAAGGGGAIANIYGGQLDMRNCTLYDNSTLGIGGGLATDLASKTTVRNSVLWNNTPDEIYTITPPATVISFSDVRGGYPGDSNIDIEPRLAFPEMGDYRLLPDSPAVDTGTDQNAPATDFTGMARPDGAAVDMGAYELPTADKDGDGLPDAYEAAGDTDGDGTPDIDDTDSDDDGINDGDEYLNRLDPTDPTDADADLDGDGLSSRDEVLTHGTDPRKADSDDDGLSDSDEIARGLDPLDPDTDGDFMSDGYEVSVGLNPKVPDATGDPDNDGLTNFEESQAQSNPFDPADPPSDVFVAKSGSDETGDGTQNTPWASIMFAMAEVTTYSTLNHPVTINVQPGTYDERVELAPHVTLRGANRDTTIIQHYNANEPEHVVVSGAENTNLENFTVTLPGLHPTVTVLVQIDDVDTDVYNCILDSGDNLFSIGLLIGGKGSSTAEVRDCTVRRVQYGVQAVDTAANINHNMFEDIRRDAVFVRLPVTKQGAAETPLLGDQQNIATTGFNWFRRVDGMFVKNANPNRTLAEYNDWGVYTDIEIEAKVDGNVDFVPFIGKALGPGSVVVNLTDSETDAQVPATANASVTLPGLSLTGVRDAETGLFVFTGVSAGSWTVQAQAANYQAANSSVTVNIGGVKSLTLALTKEEVVPPPPGCGNLGGFKGEYAFAGMCLLLLGCRRKRK